ncbi:MAG: OmpH family outer membrane protein [Gemmatimonadaceae bacterium]|nr:OmpH family outer membrane protein [Gemmatimonadaceae bacterium]NUQ94540.1 OmpH family outer membrane protein [Gemmatimonadaceae bacterium]NUR20577.1 OmpH family outer membrane protein [Gemmatimonadaceae bacterium]
MNTFVRAGLAALAFTIAPVALQAQAGLKVGYIDSRAILQQAPGRAEAEAAFQKEMQAYQTQVQRMGDSLQTLIAAYDKQELTLSPSAKATKQQQIRDRQAAYQERVQGLQDQAQQRQSELMGPIMERINQVITDLRAQEGYSFIFDVGAQGGVVVAADTTLNLTDKVIARLKAVAVRPTGTGTTPAPTTGAPAAQPAGITKPKPPAQ